MLTGFHGTHVALGVIMLLSLVGLSRRMGGLSDRQFLNLELVGLYWHFVDIIWIVIFTVVYLLTATPGSGLMAEEHHVAHPDARPSTSRSPLAWPSSPPSRWRLFYINEAVQLGWINTAALLILAFLKFVIVIGWYMHIRYEKTTVSRFFTFGFVLAFTLYAVGLISFGVLAANR